MTSLRTRSLALAALTAVSLGGAVTATATTASAAAPAAPSRTAPSATPPAPSTATFMKECLDDHLTNRPRRFTLACADANEYLDRLTWKGWGRSTATATGVLRVRDCSDSCSVGRLQSFPVKVSVNRLHRGEAAQFYTSLRVTYTKAVPAGEKRSQVYALPR